MKSNIRMQVNAKGELKYQKIFDNAKIDVAVNGNRVPLSRYITSCTEKPAIINEPIKNKDRIKDAAVVAVSGPYISIKKLASKLLVKLGAPINDIISLLIKIL